MTTVTNSSARRTGARAALAAAWLAAVVAGFAVLVRYDATPEPKAADVRVDWPADTRLAARDAAGMTVVVFLHPKCPCSSATLDELETVVGRLPTDADVRAVFVTPEGAPVEWAASELRRRAGRIARVRVEDDPGGVEARRFGAATSGTTFAYDAAGRLVFRGGITRSRGHAGDNPGSRSVASLAEGGTPEASRTPVYGCALLDEKCSADSASR